MAQKGFGLPNETAKPSRSKRGGQLEKFLQIVGRSGHAVDFSIPENSSASTMERTLANAGGFQDAYLDNSRVVFVGNAICSEIVYALDLVPFNGQVLSYFLAAAGVAGNFLDIAEKNHMSRDVCPVVRCVLGAAVEDCLPSPDFITFGYFPCDSGARMFYTLSDMYDTPWFLLDIPQRRGNSAAAYLAHRIKEMVTHMETSMGITAVPEKIASAVSESKIALRYYADLISFSLERQICPSVQKFSTDTTTHLSKLGSSQATQGIRLCYEDLLATADTAGMNHAKKGPRIIWDGLMPFYNNEIIRYMEEECGLEVMANLMPGLTRDIDDILTEEDPYMYMAKRQLHFISIDDTKFDMLEPYAIDGVIRFNQWGCRRHLSVNQIIRDRLSKAGISMLDIDGDFIDSRGYSFSQVKIRIDAFAEMLKNRSEV